MALVRSKQQTLQRHGVRLPALRSRLLRAAICSGALTLMACAAVTPPPRFSPVSPADAEAPESAVPPPKALLTGDGELADRPEPTPPQGTASPPADPNADHKEKEEPKR